MASTAAGGGAGAGAGAGADTLFIEKAFEGYDLDGGGWIDASELGKLCSELGVDLAGSQLEEALESLDRDGSGRIEKNEFVSWWVSMQDEGDATEDGIDAKLRAIAQAGRKAHFLDVHIAAYRGDCKLLKEFLDLDASLCSARDESQFGEDNTPLHYAAYCGHTEACTMLLKRNADKNAQNAAGCTPMFLAAQQGHEDIVDLLLSRKAKVDICDHKHGWSPVDVTDDPDIVTVFQQRLNLTVPERPSAPSVSLSKRGVAHVHWPKLEGEHLPVTGWRLVVKEVLGEASEGKEPEYEEVGELELHGDTYTADVNGLEPGVYYVLQLEASNRIGAGAASPHCAPFQIQQVPTAPNGVLVTGVAHDRVDIQWNAPYSGSSPIVEYAVFVRHESEGKAHEVATFDASVHGASIPLSRAGPTFVTVRAANAVGRGPSSAAASAVVPKPRDYGLRGGGRQHGSRGTPSRRSAATSRRSSSRRSITTAATATATATATSPITTPDDDDDEHGGAAAPVEDTLPGGPGLPTADVAAAAAEASGGAADASAEVQVPHRPQPRRPRQDRGRGRSRRRQVQDQRGGGSGGGAGGGAGARLRVRQYDTEPSASAIASASASASGGGGEDVSGWATPGTAGTTPLAREGGFAVNQLSATQRAELLRQAQR